MTDTNNTDGAALLPVTAADRELYARLIGLSGENLDRRQRGEPVIDALQLLTRHRIATQEDAERSGVGSVEADVEAVARALFCFQHQGDIADPGQVWDAPDKGLHPIYWTQKMEHNHPHYRAMARVALSTPQRQEYDGEAVREALTTSPLIEAITPTNDEWEACDTVQDTYDLMKRRILAALAHPAQARDEREENERLRARIADLESFLGFVETNNCNYCGASVVLMGADFLEDIMTALDKAGAPRKSPDGMIHYSMFDRIAALSSDKGEER